MSHYIPDALRIAVAQRALYRCEYCLRAEADSFIRYQIDHIISRKHGGNTVLENLAYSCAPCNGSKGSDVGTILDDEETFVRLFHPRKDHWNDHLEISKQGLFVARTIVGEATIKVLNLNDVNQLLERLALLQAGLFP